MITLVHPRRSSPPTPVQATRRRSTRASETQIRVGCASDLEAMEAFLTGLSPESSYRRFLTGLGDGAPPPGLAKSILLPRTLGGSLIALRDDVIIGHVMWGAVASVDPADDASSTAEIAIVIADQYQGQGLGSRLVDAMMPHVVRQGFDHVQAVLSAENHVVRRMIAGRVSSPRYVRDGVLVAVTVGVETLRRST